MSGRLIQGWLIQGFGCMAELVAAKCGNSLIKFSDNAGAPSPTIWEVSIRRLILRPSISLRSEKAGGVHALVFLKTRFPSSAFQV